MAGTALGGLSAVGGARTIAKELDKDAPSNGANLIDGGMGILSGVLGTVGGVGSLAGSAPLASLGPAGAVAGAAGMGFSFGTAGCRWLIDPYLNRTKTVKIDEEESTQEFEAWQRGETTITQDINNWLDSF